MGYFPNGTSADIYEREYCALCIHRPKDEDAPGCAVWGAHIFKNYDECNDDESILHILIPRGPDGENQRCRMWVLDPQADAPGQGVLW